MPVTIRTQLDELNRRRGLHVESPSTHIYGIVEIWHSCTLPSFDIDPKELYKYSWHNLHLIALKALKRVEDDGGVPLKGGVVTGTIWRKLCNLNYGCRPVWPAHVQSTCLVLQPCPDAQFNSFWNAKEMHRPSTWPAYLSIRICSGTLLWLPQLRMSRGFKMSALLWLLISSLYPVYRCCP